MDPQQYCKLAHVPLEVLIRITYYISTTDLASVRLSCKVLERALFHFFSHEFFRKKQFMVSTHSLQTLIDISNHIALSSVLKHVVIGTDRVCHEFNGHHTAALPDQHEARLAALAADHADLMTTGRLRDMLAEAFRNLPNLESVDIRDFNSPSRSRDGHGVSWKSYGSSTISRETNTPITMHHLRPREIASDTYPAQIFASLVAALGLAESRPNSIEINLRSMVWGLGDIAFFIPQSRRVISEPVLAGLTKLHLCVRHAQFGGSSHHRKSHYLMDFLMHLPNLSWLRLNFQADNPHWWRSLLEWLSRPNAGASTALSMPRLKQLDLGSIELSPDMLFKLVARNAPELRTLSLRRVILADTDKEFDMNEKFNPWVPFFNKLSKAKDLNIRELNLSLLNMKLSRQPLPLAVNFKKASGASIEDVMLSGSSTDKVVKEALGRMEVEWPILRSIHPAQVDFDLDFGVDEDDYDESDGYDPFGSQDGWADGMDEDEDMDINDVGYMMPAHRMDVGGPFY